MEIPKHCPLCQPEKVRIRNRKCPICLAEFGGLSTLMRKPPRKVTSVIPRDTRKDFLDGKR